LKKESGAEASIHSEWTCASAHSRKVSHKKPVLSPSLVVMAGAIAAMMNPEAVVTVPIVMMMHRHGRGRL
jgi:hypothetical protein